MQHISRAIRHYATITVLYLLLVLVLPASQTAMQTYHLTQLQYRILIFVVVLPLVIIWFTAFYGAAKLAQYSSLIKKTREGEDFEQLSRGSQWLAWSLPIPSLVSLCLGSIASNHPGFHGASVIITNYVNLLMALVAFTLIGRGARGLTERTKARPDISQTRAIVLLFLALGVVYCYLTFSQLHAHNLGSTANPFDLPVWLLIATVIIPYLYVWFAGLLAAYQLVFFARHTTGVFYRQPVQLLAGGFTAVIATSVAIQYLRGLTMRTGHLSLSSVLLIINLIYIVMAIGFILISISAARLKKIEEV